MSLLSAMDSKQNMSSFPCWPRVLYERIVLWITFICCLISKPKGHIFQVLSLELQRQRVHFKQKEKGKNSTFTKSLPTQGLWEALNICVTVGCSRFSLKATWFYLATNSLPEPCFVGSGLCYEQGCCKPLHIAWGY